MAISATNYESAIRRRAAAPGVTQAMPATPAVNTMNTLAAVGTLGAAPAKVQSAAQRYQRYSGGQPISLPSTPQTVTPQVAPPTGALPGTTMFGPGNDLRYTTIGGQPSTQQAQYQGQLSTAVGNLLQDRPAVDPTAGARLTNFQNLTTGAANTVANAPDRLALVQQALEDYDTAYAPKLQAGFQEVGRRSAALGRGGSGMTDEDIGNVQAQYNRDRLLTGRDLIRDATSQTLSDRIGQLSALGNLETSTAAQEAANRGEQRQEREFGTNLDLNRVGVLGGVLNQQAGLDRVGREEQRGERDYQYGVGRDAINDAVQSQLLQEQLFGNEWNRNLALAGLGSSDVLAGYLSGAGAQSANTASNYYSGAGNLLAQWLANRGNQGS